MASCAAMGGAPYLAAVGALTAAGLALRVAGMDQSLLGDELFAYEEIHGQSLGGVITQLRESVEVSPPLYFVLAWASAKLGDPTVWIRLPSVVLGTLLIPLTYLLGLRAIGPRGALVGAALIAVSPFAVFYATEARPYATLMFCAALATLTLLWAIERGGWRWAAFAAATAGVVYSHYSGIFVVVVQAAWAVAAHRDRLKQVAAANAAAAIAFLPWLGEVGGKGQLSVYGPFSPAAGDAGVLVKAAVGHSLIPLSEIPTWPALAVVGAALVVAAVLAPRGRPGPAVLLLAALALATPVGMFATALIEGHDMFIARNLSASVPAAALCLGALLAAPRGRIAAVLSVAAVCAVAFGAVKLLDADHQRAQAREAAALLDAQAGPEDPVVTVAPTDSTSHRPLDPYLRRPHARYFGDPDGYREAFARASGTGSPVFVVFPPVPEIAPLIVPPEGVDYRLVDETAFPGLGGGLAIRRFEP